MKFVQCACRKEWQIMTTLTGRCHFCRKTSATKRKSEPADLWWSEQAHAADVSAAIVQWLRGVEFVWQRSIGPDDISLDFAEVFTPPALKAIQAASDIPLSPWARLHIQVNWPDVRYFGFVSDTLTFDQMWQPDILSKQIAQCAQHFSETSIRFFDAAGQKKALLYDRKAKQMVQVQTTGISITPWKPPSP